MNAPPFALGLVVGKFAPLHRGHEWLVAQAAAQCRKVLVLSYANPAPEGCELERRHDWLHARFADASRYEPLALDDARVQAACRARGIAARPMPLDADPDPDVHHAWLAWLLAEVLGRRPDAIFGSEAYIHPCAAHLALAFGRPVQPVLADPQRRQVPISASAIRSDPVAGAHWLAPEVAAGFVRSVALMGGESSGKTTLARALAQRLGTAWVHEYGRELWEARGGALVEADLLDIAHEQIRREDAALAQARGWLVCDTTPLTTLGYAEWTHGRADPRLAALAQRRYHRLVLCEPDFAHVQDGTRREAGFRDEQHRWYLQQLQRGDAPWIRVSGSVSQRVQSVVEWLATNIRTCTPPRSPR